MSDTVHDQAEAAIQSMGGLDSALENFQTETPSTPQEPAAPQQPVPPAPQQARDEFGRWTQPPASPEAPAAPAQEQDTSFMGEGFDPNTLPPELQQRYKEMQGHWTRRNQEMAELRKQYEPLANLDPQEVQSALELREALNDPRNWVALHQELSDELQAMGYSAPQADAEASRQMQEQVPAGPQIEQLPDDDPDLQPYKQYIESLKGELDTVKGQFDDWRAEQEAAQMEMALVGEVTRQVNAIREARPDYNDTDIDAIYELASFYDGDLIQAQHRYESIIQDRMSRYIASKEVAPQQAPLSGAGTTTAIPSSPKTFEEARASALEIAAQMDSAY